MLHRAIFDWCPLCAGKEDVKIGDAPQLKRIPQEERQKLYDEQVNSYSYEDYTCPNGHRTIGLYQNMQYEFLLDMALEDLLNSNFRGAYFNFAAAEEQFYEFIIRLICKDFGALSEEFETTWKIIGNLTERQYGAYCLLYLTKLGKSPPNKAKIKLGKTGVINLRNKVIHKGYKPTEKETKFYGGYVLNTIFDTLVALTPKLKEDTVHLVVSDKLQKFADEFMEKLKVEKVDLENIRFATICGGSICSQLFVAEPKYKCIEELLSQMKDSRERFKFHYSLR